MKNLVYFTVQVLNEVLIASLEEAALPHNAGGVNHFTQELHLMAIKAFDTMTHNAKLQNEAQLAKLKTTEVDRDIYNLERMSRLSNDRAVQMVLKALYEPLINRLMQCKPEDIINILGFDAYLSDPVLACEGI